MVKNHPQYPDAVCDIEKGIMPRCLIYEEDGRNDPAKGAKGVVIVGINPGRSRKSEREYYKNRKDKYESIVEYWNEEIGNRPYYTRCRAFVDSIGLSGPILWTELVKCESQRDVKLSVQTIRDSINRYLFKELEIIPKDWPLIGVGNQAFEILSYRFPDRMVVGIPHAAGSYGQFNKLFSSNRINPKAKKYIKKEFLEKRKPIANAFKCRGGECRFW